MRRSLAGLVLVLTMCASGCTAGCRADFAAGSSPREQLCTVLGADAADVDALTPLVDGAAEDPASPLPGPLLSIALIYRTHEDAFDDLGPYRAAIELTAALVELAEEGLAGSSTLSPEVRASVGAIDATLERDPCDT